MKIKPDTAQLVDTAGGYFWGTAELEDGTYFIAPVSESGCIYAFENGLGECFEAFYTIYFEENDEGFVRFVTDHAELYDIWKQIYTDVIEHREAIYYDYPRMAADLLQTLEHDIDDPEAAEYIDRGKYIVAGWKVIS